ncbi:MAG: Fucose permease [Mycobacterium sp.]|nr:Fucose permease [Mycobacterium sp.]
MVNTLIVVSPNSSTDTAPMRKRRLALYVAMLTLGVLIASWVTRTPAIRDEIGVSTTQLGLVLFGVSIGSMHGILSSSRVVRQWGGRRVLSLGTGCAAAGTAIIGVSTHAANPIGVFAGMAVFGFGIGVGEVALNIEASAIEERTGRIILPMVHGFFSLGTVVGAAIGIAANAFHTSVLLHLTITSLTGVVALGSTLRWIPPGTGRANNRRSTPRQPRVWAVWRDRTVICIGAVALATALAEGSANDWLPLIFVDGYDLPAVLGSELFTAFAAAMAVGRFAGNRALAYVTRMTLIRFSIVAAMLGIGLVVWAPNAYFAAAAVVLWGLGASLGFPLAISAAGDHPTDAVARVSAVSVTAYGAFLVGPPLLGTAGGHVGLRYALIIVLVVLAVALASSGGMRPGSAARHDPPSPEDDDMDQLSDDPSPGPGEFDLVAASAETPCGRETVR